MLYFIPKPLYCLQVPGWGGLLRVASHVEHYLFQPTHLQNTVEHLSHGWGASENVCLRKGK